MLICIYVCIYIYMCVCVYIYIYIRVFVELQSTKTCRPNKLILLLPLLPRSKASGNLQETSSVSAISATHCRTKSTDFPFREWFRAWEQKPPKFPFPFSAAVCQAGEVCAIQKNRSWFSNSTTGPSVQCSGRQGYKRGLSIFGIILVNILKYENCVSRDFSKKSDRRRKSFSSSVVLNSSCAMSVINTL